MDRQIKLCCRENEGRSRKAGAALVTALVLSLVIAMVVGAALLLVQQHYGLSFAHARSESALLLSEGGINDEIHFITQHLGETDPTKLSTQPVVVSGETAVYPGDTTPVKGRKGTVLSQPDKNFWVFSSLDEAGTTGWDGKTAEFWMHGTGLVNGSWRRSKVKVRAYSVFSLFAIFALASYPNASNAIQLSSATTTVIGTGGTNGTVIDNNSTLVVSDAINANTASVPNGQFQSSNVATGGSIVTRTDPIIFPSVTSVVQRQHGLTGYTEANTWAWMFANNSNNTGIYTWADHPSSTTISTSNCKQLNLGISTLVNKSGNTKGAWETAGYRPGSYQSVNGLSITAATNTSPIAITTSTNHNLATGNSVTISGVTGNTAANGTWKITKTGPKTYTLNGSTGNAAYVSGGTSYPNEVRTLIFEPGDYVFSYIDLMYDYQTRIIIDPEAQASGGTPGQVRIWIYDPSNGTQNDFWQLPITWTYPSGSTEADPTLFRVYYAKDGKTFQFARPSSVTYIDETTHQLADLTGDFTVYGGVYAVTKLPGDTSPSKGTQIDFTGSTGGTGGNIKLVGSLLADKLSFHGPSIVEFKETNNINDPLAGVGVIGSYLDNW